MSSTQFTAEEIHSIEQENQLQRYIMVPLMTIGFYLVTFPLPDNGWGQGIATLIFGYILFIWTSFFHECVHQTFFPVRWANVLVGRIQGTVMLTPYNVYRESHIRHHAYLNKPADWELWPYSDPNRSIGFRRCFVWIDLVFGFLTSPFIYGRIFFHKKSPITDKNLRRTIWLEYLVIVLAWGGVLGLVAWNNWWWEFLFIWVLPHMVAGTIQTGRKMTEHLGMQSYDPLQGTRTVMGRNWLTRLLTKLNFDIFIHGPHHRHPRVSHSNLKRKMQEYDERHPDAQYPVYSTYTAASLSMIPWLFKNPGVGVNRGAEMPKDKLHIDNFVQDVERDIIAAEKNTTDDPSPRR